MSTRNLPGGKWRPARNADNSTAISEPIFWKMCDPRRLTTLWASTACYSDRFTFFIYIWCSRTLMLVICLCTHTHTHKHHAHVFCVRLLRLSLRSLHSVSYRWYRFHQCNQLGKCVHVLSKHYCIYWSTSLHLILLTFLYDNGIQRQWSQFIIKQEIRISVWIYKENYRKQIQTCKVNYETMKES
jgi:hypothetical protein